MTDHHLNDDPWAIDPKNLSDRSAEINRTGSPSFETILEVAPLESQFESEHQASVPDALYDVLFGRSTQFDLGLEIINPPNDQHLAHLYAIIDAAKVMNLPELLEVSGLDHICLYKGISAEDLSHVAPWIVKLEENNSFTRKLFTRGDAPWHLWDNEAGIFSRGAATLEQVQSHFRRFIKPRDETGRSLFFRFWDPRVLRLYLAQHHASAREHVLSLMGSFTFIVTSNRYAQASVFRAPYEHGAVRPRATGPWPALSRDLAAIRLMLFKENLTDRMTERHPAFESVDDADRLAIFSGMTDDALRSGFRQELSIERFCEVSLILGRSPVGDARFAPFFRSPQHELDRSRKMLNHAKAILLR